MRKNLDSVRPLESLLNDQCPSLKVLADKSGISYDSIVSYNIGRRSPTLEKTAKICKVLGVPFKDLAVAMGIDVEGIPDTLKNALE